MLIGGRQNGISWKSPLYFTASLSVFVLLILCQSAVANHKKKHPSGAYIQIPVPCVYIWCTLHTDEAVAIKGLEANLFHKSWIETEEASIYYYQIHSDHRQALCYENDRICSHPKLLLPWYTITACILPPLQHSDHRIYRIYIYLVYVLLSILLMLMNCLLPISVLFCRADLAGQWHAGGRLVLQEAFTSPRRESCPWTWRKAAFLCWREDTFCGTGSG